MTISRRIALRPPDFLSSCKPLVLPMLRLNPLCLESRWKRTGMSILRRLFRLAYWFGTPKLWFTSGRLPGVVGRSYMVVPDPNHHRVDLDAYLRQPPRI